MRRPVFALLSVSPPLRFARSPRKKTARFASASSSTPMARARFTKPMRPITKPSPPPRAKMGSCAKKFDGIWMRAGRFLRGEVFGPKEQFRFILQNKYDANNRLIEETHFAKDQSVIGKIVFRYDAAGHQIGYSPMMAPGNFSAKRLPLAFSGKTEIGHRLNFRPRTKSKVKHGPRF